MGEVQSWPPGWFPDPTGRHDHRWWDGLAWTGHVADAGVAGLDPLPGAPPPYAGDMVPVSSIQGPGVRFAAPTPGTDGVAVAATVVGIGSLPLAILPFLGLLPAIVAIILAVVARSRLRSSGRSGSGLALTGLIVGIIALTIAVAVTVFSVLVLSGSGGELSEAFRDYLACLEVSSAELCQVQFEDSVMRILER
jgi:hypothetical protein